MLRVLATWMLTVAMLLSGCVDDRATAAEGEASAGPAARVIALEWTYAEDLLAVGILPVGVADPEGYRKWVVSDPSLPESVASVGTRQEPSLEAMVQLQPDLILGVAYRQAAVLDTLEAIAPTLLFEAYDLPAGQTQYGQMRETFLRIADAVGRRVRGEAVLADLDRSLAAARQRIEQLPLEHRRFILVQTFTAKNAPVLRIFTDDAMAVQILEQMGLENAWTAADEGYGFSTVGLDALVGVGDVHLLYVAQSEDDPLGEELREHAVWRRLPMVQSGRVHPLGGDAWLFGGPVSAKVLAERVLEAVTGAQP